jgi:DNA mismatch repair protein MutL
MTARPAQIRLLPDAVINKIAAGEVVERPASVLKELMENAVDAGATQIDVEIVSGGRKLVAVSDNGSGMDRDNALLAIERHATSKIRDVNDIEHIATLGFRGEALAAIASVSRFRLVTALREGAAGTEVNINGGRLQDVRDTGCPPGTRIEVRDLFFNVPARRKFLRSYETEQAHLRSTFIVMALAHPQVGMSLKADDRDLHRLAEGATPEQRLRDLFGADYVRHMRPVQHRALEGQVTGFVGLPSFNRPDRTEQYVFINGRAATAPVLSFAIREAYHSLLPDKRQPCLVLFLEIDPTQVDVNVHPTKREVRFRDNEAVREAVMNAIRNTLRQNQVAAAPGLDAGQPFQSASIARAGDPPVAPFPAKSVQLEITDLPAMPVFAYPRISASLDRMAAPAERDAPSSAGPAPDGRSESPATAASGKASPWGWCRLVGQVGGLYVLLETEEGFVVMDPHAAHERILYERFMADVLKGAVKSQALLIPETVNLQTQDAARLRKNAKLLREMGFGIEEFGGSAFVVDAMPSYFAGSSAESLLVEVSHTLEQMGSRGGTGRWREEAVAQAACKAAVKARQKLNLSEIERLVADLTRTELPYTCPHGRPTLIFTSFKELDKKFGRA